MIFKGFNINNEAIFSLDQYEEKITTNFLAEVYDYHYLSAVNIFIKPNEDTNFKVGVLCNDGLKYEILEVSHLEFYERLEEEYEKIIKMMKNADMIFDENFNKQSFIKQINNQLKPLGDPIELIDFNFVNKDDYCIELFDNYDCYLKFTIKTNNNIYENLYSLKELSNFDETIIDAITNKIIYSYVF